MAKPSLRRAVAPVVETIESRVLMSVQIGAYAEIGTTTSATWLGVGWPPFAPVDGTENFTITRNGWTRASAYGPAANPGIQFEVAKGIFGYWSQDPGPGTKISGQIFAGESSEDQEPNASFDLTLDTSLDPDVWRRADNSIDESVGHLGGYPFSPFPYGEFYNKLISATAPIEGGESTFEFKYGGSPFQIGASVTFGGYTGPLADVCSIPNSTGDPVRYADGAARLEYGDFLPTASTSTTLGRSWSNSSYTADSQAASFGNGIGLDGIPHLQNLTPQMVRGYINEMGPGKPGGFAVVESSTSAYAVFQYSATRYENIALGEQRKTTFHNSGNKIVQVDPDGTITTYANFLDKTTDSTNGWSPNQMGQMISRVYPNGDGLYVKWDATHDRPEYYRTVAKKAFGTGYDADQFTFGYDNASTDAYGSYFVDYVTQSKGTVSAIDDASLTSSRDVRTVEYKYYDSPEEEDENPGGVWGDLKYVIKHDGGLSSPVVETNYYRWMMPTWTSPGDGIRLLKSAMGNDSYLKAIRNVGDIDSASDEDLADYVDNAFTYTSDNKVYTETASGAGAGCSCGKTGIGTYTFDYSENTSTASGTNAWRYRTTVDLPDGNKDIVYTNGSGQVLLTVTYDHDSQKYYSKWYQYDSMGNVTHQAEGKAILPYNSTTRTDFEAFADLVGYGQSNSKLRDSARIDVTNYFTALDTADRTLYTYEKNAGYQIGASGAFVMTDSWSYGEGALNGDGVWNVASETSYPDVSPTTVQRTTTYDYEFYQIGGVNTLRPKIVTTILPKIVSGQNGADSSSTSVASSYQTKTYYDMDGHVVWYVDANGYITYSEYDQITGAKTKYIQDVDPSSITSPIVAGPSRALSSTALNLTTSILNDDQGRRVKVTDPNGNITYTVYDDSTGEHKASRVLTYPGWNASTKQSTAPVQAIIEDPATGIRDTITYTWTGSGGLPVDSNGVPAGTEDFSSSNFHIQSLVREIRNVSGQVVEVREYTDFGSLNYVPDNTTTMWVNLGAVGTNYLSTKYKYDSGARLYETTTPDGTVTMSVYDARGLKLSEWKGTNNASAVESDPTGGGATGNNMKLVAEFTYDDSGNQLTAKSVYGDGSGDSYTTTNRYDFRDRLVDSRGPDKIAVKYAYNNVGEQIFQDRYADADADFSIDAGEWIDGAGSFYDAQGQVYRLSLYLGTGTNALGVTLASLSASTTIGDVTATATKTGHGYTTGQVVTIWGASDAAYNGTFVITVVDSNTFTYSFNTDSTISTSPTGTIKSALRGAGIATEFWYDKAGKVVKTKSPTGLLNKSFYDGAGRAVATLTSVDNSSSESSWANSQTASGDAVIEQNDYIFDKGGRTRLVTNWKYDDTGGLGDGADPSPSASTYDHTSMAYWYDAADRMIASADYGRDGNEDGATSSDALVWNTSGYSIKDSDSDKIPNVIDGAQDADPGLDNASSQTAYRWIYTGYRYDDAGNLSIVLDNTKRNAYSGDTELRQTHYVYDFAGRKRKMIENYVDGTASETETDTDRTTQYDYDNQSRLATQTALNPLGAGQGVQSQVTSFAYTSNVDRSWVTTTVYGDAVSTGVSNTAGVYSVSGTDGQFVTYDRLGRKTSETDQRGVKHSYSYDSTGRLETDSLDTASLPSGVDSRVRIIQYAYDTQSRISKITSKYDSSTIVNEVAYGYDVYGNVNYEAQAHDEAVDSSTPATRYLYNGADGHFLYKQTYPSDAGTSTIVYNPDGDAINWALNRPANIYDADGNGYIDFYYLGLNQITWTSYLSGGAFHTYGTMSDHYVNLDRYGRLKTVVWEGNADSTGGIIDSRNYSYDRMGNRLKADIANISNYDEIYTYDGLNRLAGYTRGTLGSGTISSPKFTQSWTLDALGNWRGYSQANNDTTLLPGVSSFTQSRTVNAANEITATAGGGYAATAYDAAGNMTATPKTGSESTTLHSVYDGWNRLAGIDSNGDGDLNDSGDTRYSYDGLGRQITKFKLTAANGTAGTTEESFYNQAGQIVETYAGTVTGGSKSFLTSPAKKTIWDPSYVDAPLAVEQDLDSDGLMDFKAYPIWDANHNIIGLLNADGELAESYVYTPYGQQTVLNGTADIDGTAGVVDTGGSDYGFDRGFQGLRWDVDAAEWRTQSRPYSASLGAFVSRDPLGTAYQDGMNLYQFVRNNPVIHTDLSGYFTDSEAIDHAKKVQESWYRDGNFFAAELAWNFIYNKHAKNGVKFPDAGDAYQKYAKEIGESFEFMVKIVGAIDAFLYQNRKDEHSGDWSGTVPDHTVADLKAMKYWTTLSYGPGEPLFYSLGDATVGNKNLKVSLCKGIVRSEGSIFVNDLYNFAESGPFGSRNIDADYRSFNHLATKMGRVAFWHSEKIDIKVEYDLNNRPQYYDGYKKAFQVTG